MVDHFLELVDLQARNHSNRHDPTLLSDAGAWLARTLAAYPGLTSAQLRGLIAISDLALGHDGLLLVAAHPAFDLVIARHLATRWASWDSSASLDEAYLSRVHAVSAPLALLMRLSVLWGDPLRGSLLLSDEDEEAVDASVHRVSSLTPAQLEVLNHLVADRASAAWDASTGYVPAGELNLPELIDSAEALT